MFRLFSGSRAPARRVVPPRSGACLHVPAHARRRRSGGQYPWRGARAHAGRGTPATGDTSGALAAKSSAPLCTDRRRGTGRTWPLYVTSALGALIRRGALCAPAAGAFDRPCPRWNRGDAGTYARRVGPHDRLTACNARHTRQRHGGQRDGHIYAPSSAIHPRRSSSSMRLLRLPSPLSVTVVVRHPLTPFSQAKYPPPRSTRTRTAAATGTDKKTADAGGKWTDRAHAGPSSVATCTPCLLSWRLSRRLSWRL